MNSSELVSQTELEYEFDEAFLINIVGSFLQYNSAREDESPALSASMPLNRSKVSSYTSLVFDKLREHFEIKEYTNVDISPWIYVQNNKIHNNYFHNHFPSTISTVYYPSISTNGGGLEVVLFNNEGPYIENIKVKTNVLYMFPGWLVHRPAPQLDSKFRICVNVDFNFKERVLHKRTKTYW